MTVTPIVTGVASYSNAKIEAGTATASSYDLKLSISAFNPDDSANVQIQTLKTKSANVKAADGTPLGTESYAVKSLDCAAPTGPKPYTVLMLFDRSGSMKDNDPDGDTLEAAREFARRMSPSDKGWIAAFPKYLPARTGDPTTFYGTAGFTADQSLLLAHISSVGAPENGTPLWDSSVEATGKFPTTQNPNENRALLIFSDGEDSGAQGGSKTKSAEHLRTEALARGVKVFAVNLRNADSRLLDSVAVATDGNVYSTSDAKALLAFYKTLGKVLSNQDSKCTLTVGVTFAPADGIGDTGYGPSTGSVPFNFTGMAGQTKVATSVELTTPLYPGRKIGQTLRGTAVFETDVSQVNGDSCLKAASPTTVRNSCTETIFVTVCASSAPASCNRGLVGADGIVGGVESLSRACAWREPLQKYEPVSATGTGPSTVYSAWVPGAPTKSCINTARGPY